MKHLAQIITALLLTALTGCGSAGETKPDPKARLAEAEARFAERCKTSGEFIKRTVDNVEGIYLLKLRPAKINYGSQFEMDDPYGRDFGSDAYIKSFLHGAFQAGTSSTPAPGSPPRLGYRYVEVINSLDGRRYRYTGSVKDVTRTSSILMGGDGKTTFKSKEFVLDKVLVSGTEPRYGVTYDDISTREDRELWIAGSSLKVIDLKANYVIAERIGYMMDRGQGNNSGGRSAWLVAADNACPSFQRNPNFPLSPNQGAGAQLNQTQDFVEKVLHPIAER
jgi:hypothetical protein